MRHVATLPGPSLRHVLLCCALTLTTVALLWPDASCVTDVGSVLGNDVHCCDALRLLGPVWSECPTCPHCNCEPSSRCPAEAMQVPRSKSKQHMCAAYCDAALLQPKQGPRESTPSRSVPALERLLAWSVCQAHEVGNRVQQAVSDIGHWTAVAQREATHVEAALRAMAADSASPDTRQGNALLALRAALEAASRNNCVHVTAYWSNDASLVHNWWHWLLEVDALPALVLTDDASLAERLGRSGIRAHDVSALVQPWALCSRDRGSAIKVRVLVEALRWGFSVVYSDTDVLWHRAPSCAALLPPGVQASFQAYGWDWDSMQEPARSPPTLNMGCFAVRSTPGTRALVQRVWTRMVTSVQVHAAAEPSLDTCNDQNMWNAVLRSPHAVATVTWVSRPNHAWSSRGGLVPMATEGGSTPSESVRIAIFPPKQFPMASNAGDDQDLPLWALHLTTFWGHARAKAWAMVQAGLWKAPQAPTMMTQTTRLLTVASLRTRLGSGPASGCLAEQVALVEAAALLAAATNRTLVWPSATVFGSCARVRRGVPNGTPLWPQRAGQSEDTCSLPMVVLLDPLLERRVDGGPLLTLDDAVTDARLSVRKLALSEGRNGLDSVLNGVVALASEAHLDLTGSWSVSTMVSLLQSLCRHDDGARASVSLALARFQASPMAVAAASALACDADCGWGPCHGWPATSATCRWRSVLL